IRQADQLSFNQLRFVEDLIRVCYAPEGDQSDQPCRLRIPVPLPPAPTDFPTPRPTPASTPTLTPTPTNWRAV
ncbi:hypothetical protein NW823_00465, partial [Synechococcus sp. R55.1]